LKDAKNEVGRADRAKHVAIRKGTQVFDQVFDTEQRGLCLRISESGENHFPFAISTAAYETFNI